MAKRGSVQHGSAASLCPSPGIERRMKNLADAECLAAISDEARAKLPGLPEYVRSGDAVGKQTPVRAMAIGMFNWIEASYRRNHRG